MSIEKRTRRPTSPIPRDLVGEFYRVAWEIAIDGEYTALNGTRQRYQNRQTARRHAIAVLWLSACALRFSELRRLRVSDVSEAGFSAFITRSKGGLSGNVPLSELLVSTTFKWRSNYGRVFESPWLLPSKTGAPLSINAFNRDACESMFGQIFGLKLSSHCFRDTACQLALAQSGQIRVVQRLLGHRSAITTEHYIRKQSDAAFQLRLYEREYVEAVS